MNFTTTSFRARFALSLSIFLIFSQLSFAQTNTCRVQDSLQLVSLYNATGGANWTNKWNLSQPINTWYGVTLNTDGCVQKVNLALNNLVGTLPNLNLPSLISFMVSSNQLSGTIPNFSLPNLQTLDMNTNKFTGTIPNFNLPNLLYLSLSANQLNGIIPNFNLPKLQYLYLSANQLNGTIPNFNLPNLQALGLSTNQLSGTLPNLNLPNLTYLNLNSNQFSGCIPASFKSLCGKQVDIYNNPSLPTQYFSDFCTNNIGSCDVNCTSKSSAPWSEWIAQVQLNTLNNASEKTRADRYVVGYSDWTDKTAHVSRNQTYTLTILNGLSWSGYRPSLFYRAWIDFNGNGVFEDTESVLEQGNIGVGVYQSITIPATALIGTVKMRVSMKKDALPTACETFAAGEVEDYSVVIQDGTTGGCTPSVPTKLYAKDITAATAKLVWSKVNNAVEYEYQVLYDDTSQPNGGALISSGIVADTFANLTLVSGRLRALVRSRCVAGGTWSAWSLATHFNQQNELCTQAARTAFIEDFENTPVATTATTFGLPLCWTKLTYHAPSVIEAWTDVRSTSRGTVGDNTKRVVMFRSTPMTDSALIMLVSPEISNLAAGTNRLRFKAANTFGSEASGNAIIQIGTLNNPFDASSFTPFGNQTVINGQVFAEYIVDFAAYRGSDRYIVFKYISSGGDFFRSLEIDDVAWETRPSNPCLNDVTPPVLTNCPANISITTTGTTAVATWIAPTATDNCTTTPPSVTSTFSSGQSFPIGTTSVVYTARDAANNSATCSFSIVVSASTVTANCVSKSNAPWSEWIANVQFNTLNNTSSKTRDDRFVVGYSDWKDKSTTVSRSQTYPLSITPGLSWAGYQTPLYFRAWIDFNRNGIYEDTELVLEKNSNSAVVNQSVTIPATASIGTTTMRVSMKKGAYATACESFDLGEVEDYTVVIQDGNPTSCTNNALNFDGIDDYLQTPTNIIPANSDFTMEASFTSTATTVGCNGGFKRLLALELTSSSNRLEIGDCSGQLNVYYQVLGGANGFTSVGIATNLRDGNWHHVAAVKKGDTLYIYYDGALLMKTNGMTNINNAPRALYVGRWGLQGENWQGNVDEVRVWNYAVSETDIVNRRNCQLSGTESGLILYFPFNQGISGGSNTTITNVTDKSPSNSATPMSNFGKQGSTSNFVCSTQTLTQGCMTDPCATDVTPPVFANCPQNINLTALAGSTTAIATWTAPTATDNCGVPSVSSNYTGGGTFFIGTTTVIYTAKDLRNNTTTCNFNVVVAPSSGTNDLEVSVVPNAPTFKKWTNTGFKVNLKNLGSQVFTNIELTFPYPTGTVNGGTPTPSGGTFQQYCAGGVICYKWTIPSLAAGVTATLDVPLFVLDVATILGTAQLLTSTPIDVNAANNTATATMTLQTIVPSLTSKPTQLIPVVIQTLSPNPTDGELSLKLESLDTREVVFEFYNALGKAVKSETRVVEKGLSRVDFSLFDLEQGVYFIVPSTGQGRKMPTKFVKL